jgi:catechol 2,3-dioxygenase-like lactoylglutathione lyase family enzyme
MQPVSAAVLFVEHLPKMLAFYRGVVAATVLHSGEDHVVLDVSGFQITLHGMRGPKHVRGQDRYPTREDTHVKLALPVPDLAAAREAAARLGGELWPPEREWAARGFRACDGRDPEGNVFQLRQVQDAKPALRASVPLLAARDVSESIAYFQRLGFELLFTDEETAPKYAGLVRDGIELHLQWNDAGQWVDGLDRPIHRFLVDDVDGLFAEFTAAGATHDRSARVSPWAMPSDTPWGTREFHLRDPADNGLQFFRPRA